MSFKIRDYLSHPPRILYQPGGQRQQEDRFEDYEECKMNRDEVWRSAKKRISATKAQGLSVKADDFDFWRKKLADMTSSESKGTESESVKPFPVCPERPSENDAVVSVDKNQDSDKQPDEAIPLNSNSISLWAFAGKHGPGKDQLANASRLLCFVIGSGTRPCFDGVWLRPEGREWLDAQRRRNPGFLYSLGIREPRVKDITERLFTEEDRLLDHLQFYALDWNQTYVPNRNSRDKWFTNRSVK